MQEVVLTQEVALTGDDVQEIVARASTIFERLTDEFLPDERSTDDAVVAKRLDAWRQNVSKGDAELFQRRLEWDGLDPDAVRGVLGRVRLREGASLPAWVDLLRGVVTLAGSLAAGAGASSTGERERFLHAEQPMPFEEVLAPFVLLARQRLAAEAGEAYTLLADEAHAMLERSLLQGLARFASQALYLQFSIMRAREQSPLARLFALAQNADDRSLYQEFVERMLRGKLVSFFREYPVLARLLATVTMRWVEANAEFLHRLEADRDEIRRVFGGDVDDLGQVTTVQTSLSDPHNGGRSVMVLKFATGLKLVYKPKNLGSEEAYIRLLGWLNERGAPLPFRLLTVINHGSHGWVEFVEQLPCQDVAEAQRYFLRSGMMLCLGYALEGTDWHFENLIASGEHPVVVDMEAMLHHRARPADEDDASGARLLAMEQLANSVLRLGLLPEWRVGKDGDVAYDMSGLGAGDAQDVPYKIQKWEHVNTDRMTLEYTQGRMQGQASIPRMAETPLTLAEYGDDLVTGFRQMYQFLTEQRDALLAPDSPLHELGRQQVRFIFRGTRIYGLILKQLTTPVHLRDGADQSILLELLARAGLPLWAQPTADQEPPVFWPLLAAERQAMEQTDIPFFTARADSDALVIGDRVIEQFFVEPSIDLAVRRLQAFGQEDFERQVAIIRGVLYTHLARDTTAAPTDDDDESTAELSGCESLECEALVAEAMAIAEEIRARAITAEDGSATWIAPIYNVQVERYQLKPAGYDLYNGTGGIALFLGAVDKVTGGTRYGDLARGAMHPLRHALERYGARLADQLGIGGASGLGSVVYALVQLSQFLDDPALLEDARQAALLITFERIAADKTLDIIAGTAGASLGLLALQRVAPDPEILERAIACGRHLVDARVMAETGYRAWPTIGGKCLTGFSHGAAGIAYALLRLYETTGEAEFLDAAREGIAYEASVFVPEAGNWPDFRHEEQPAFMSAWCHGAAGIGLARLGGLPLLDTAGIRADVEAALQTTQQQGAMGIDLLCCGTLGRLEFLLAAAERLSRPELTETARQHASGVIRRTRRRGSYLIHHLLPDGVYSPGFFRGTAGIGYELLRLAYPDRVPSVLLWE